MMLSNPLVFSVLKNAFGLFMQPLFNRSDFLVNFVLFIYRTLLNFLGRNNSTNSRFWTYSYCFLVAVCYCCSNNLFWKPCCLLNIPSSNLQIAFYKTKRIVNEISRSYSTPPTELHAIFITVLSTHFRYIYKYPRF